VSELHHEDRTILAVLEALEAGKDAGSLAGAAAAQGDEAGETLARLYTEVVGLLPFALEPVTPSPDLRQRILTLAAGDETQDLAEGSGAAAAGPAESAARRPRVVTPIHQPPTAGAVAEPVESAGARPRRASRWPLALAASLAFALLGLSLWLYSGVRQQNATIDRLTRELRAEQQRAGSLAAQQAEIQNELAEMRGGFGLITSPAVEVSPMRPTERSPQPQARGALWVAADHQHWYLSVHGLEPLGEGRRYHLWFLADSGAVSGGSFDARPGSPVNLSSEHMPHDTRAVVITMEPDTGTPAPSGPEVLRASGKMVL
jgi:hypothetical protein